MRVPEIVKPVNVAITGGAGQIAYSLLHQLAAGLVLGKDQPINLRLLELPSNLTILKGVAMELEDLGLPLLKDVIITDDLQIAFSNVQIVFLIGAIPRKEGMARKDLLSANVKIFKTQGEALNKYARKDVKVLVVGNPANTNALICMRHAPSIPKENFAAMTRLDQNRAQSLLASYIGVEFDKVKNVIIWGNHSSTMYPDASHATVEINGCVKPVTDVVRDEKWLKETFVNTVRRRGEAVIRTRGRSSALSAAKAAGDHMRDWWFGTKPNEIVCMGVLSDGSYGIPKNIVYSMPVVVKDGQYHIVRDLEINNYARTMMDLSVEELEEERSSAESVLCLQMNGTNGVKK